MEKVVLLIIAILTLATPSPNDDEIEISKIIEFPEYKGTIRAGYLTITA